MGQTAQNALADALGAEPPPGLLSVLDDAQLVSLAETVRAARAQQTRALAKAGDDALRHLPAIVRKAVLRVLR